MTVIPLTILFHEGPQGRAYLALLRRRGFCAQRIISMVLNYDVSTKKEFSRWLPNSLRLYLAKRNQDLRLNFWARQLRRKNSDLFKSLGSASCTSFNHTMDLFDEMYGSLDFYNYAEKVQEVCISGYSDPLLERCLNSIPKTTILFTGGGLVPESLLKSGNHRFIHVHPGYLPFVRGSDGSLWSLLVRGRLGISCFFMTPGIDEGAVIAAQELDPPVIDISGKKKIGDQTLYRAFYSFFDPILRASFLTDLIIKNPDIGSWAGTSQNNDESIVYHFMNSMLRRNALNRIFHIN